MLSFIIASIIYTSLPPVLLYKRLKLCKHCATTYTHIHYHPVHRSLIFIQDVAWLISFIDSTTEPWQNRATQDEAAALGQTTTVVVLVALVVAAIRSESFETMKTSRGRRKSQEKMKQQDGPSGWAARHTRQRPPHATAPVNQPVAINFRFSLSLSSLPGRTPARPPAHHPAACLSRSTDVFVAASFDACVSAIASAALCLCAAANAQRQLSGGAASAAAIISLPGEATVDIEERIGTRIGHIKA